MDPRLELVISQIRGDFERAKQIHGEWYGEYNTQFFVKEGEVDGAIVNGRRIKFCEEPTEKVDRRQ